MLSILLTILISTYPWPIRPFGSAHQVSATLGDARESVANTRFHRGIDIPASAGTKVYSIISDTAKWDGSSGINAYVRVGDYWYIHLDSASRIEEGSYVLGVLDTINTSPDSIGKVLDYPNGDHLHFQIGSAGPPEGPFFNPLSYDGGPIGYDDDGIPKILSVDFWVQGSDSGTSQQFTGNLNGKVDIRVRCRDIQTSGGGNNSSGIYRVSYSIANKYGHIVYNSGTTIAFPQVQPPNNGAQVLLVYDQHNYRTASPFYYWVTNYIDPTTYQVIDAYWNTKLHLGFPWDSSDARINIEAQTPDGNCSVWVLGYDIMGNGGDTINRRGAEDENIILDNFVPYVKIILLAKNHAYNAIWGGAISDDELGDLQVFSRDEFLQGELSNMNITLLFSEQMNINENPNISAIFEGSKNTYNLEVNGNWVEYDLFSGTISFPSSLQDNDTGKVVLKIS